MQRFSRWPSPWATGAVRSPRMHLSQQPHLTVRLPRTTHPGRETRFICIFFILGGARCVLTNMGHVVPKKLAGPSTAATAGLSRRPSSGVPRPRLPSSDRQKRGSFLQRADLAVRLIDARWSQGSVYDRTTDSPMTLGEDSVPSNKIDKQVSQAGLPPKGRLLRVRQWTVDGTTDSPTLERHLSRGRAR